jgi:hypothetical protein
MKRDPASATIALDEERSTRVDYDQPRQRQKRGCIRVAGSCSLRNSGQMRKFPPDARGGSPSAYSCAYLLCPSVSLCPEKEYACRGVAWSGAS